MQRGRYVGMTLTTFQPTGRPSKLQDATLWKPKDPSLAPRKYLSLQCSPLVAHHFKLVHHGGVQLELPQYMAPHNYCFDFAEGYPTEVWTFVRLLKDVLTLRSPEHLDVSVALDWYTQPQGDGQFWPTEVGALVQRVKYWVYGDPQAVRDAKDEVAARLVDVIERHPLLSSAPTIVTVPGSKADFKSVGERLARYLAVKTSKTVVQTECPSGPRTPRKEDPSVNVMGQFVMPQALKGPVLVIDDVYKSGSSMNAVAAAARAAGATAVYGLAIAKTLSN
jgi:hypothetical protein